MLPPRGEGKTRMKEKMPLITAGVLALVLTLWMASGCFRKGETPEPTTSQAQRIMRETVVHGRTQANRQVQLRAEVPGTVETIGAARGSTVRGGAVVVALDLRDRAARVAQAQASLQQAQMEADAARQLATQGLQAQSQLAAAETALEGARAALTLAGIDLDRARIAAPFPGRLADRFVEVGDYVQAGDPIALLLDLDPIVVTGFLTEREVADVHVGAQASASLATGERISGAIRFVASSGDPQSRMFRVEMEAPNADGRIRAGVTAQLAVPHDPVMAHLISPAHLTLTDTGDIGVLLADAEGVTRFQHVELVRNDPAGIWVSGLPERVTIVTTGKDFVRPGDRVQVALERDSAAPAGEAGEAAFEAAEQALP